MIQPDLILMDLDLPDIDGHELTSRLKMFMPQTPILITANHPQDGQLLAPVPGSDGLLTKPIDLDELWRNVQTLLTQSVKLPELDASPELLDDKVVKQFEAQIAALNQANNRLASLNAVSALIGTSLDLEHLTDEILGQFHNTVDFDSATLFLLKGNILEAAASRGLLGYRRGMNVYTKNERNSAWRVVNHKLPLIIGDVTKSEYWEPRPELSQVRSWLGVPLIYKDRVVGVLTLDKNTVGGFTDADARYLFTLAYQIAIAVENAQLFQEWEEQSSRLKLVNEISQEITTILDVDDLYDILARAIFERLHYDHVTIFEVSEAQPSLVLKAIYGDYPALFKLGVYRQDVNVGLIGRAVRTGMPILVNDVRQDNDFLSVEGLDTRSKLVVPIFVGNEVTAVINVDRNYPDGFGDQDLWTLSSLASQAATVIENAWLYRYIGAHSDQLERVVVARTLRLQAIRKISQVVSQGSDVNELLMVVGQDISQIFTPEDADYRVKVIIGLISGSHLVLRTFHDTRPGDENDEQNMSSLFGKVLGTRQKFDLQAPVGQAIGQSKPMILNNFETQNIFSSYGVGEGNLANSLMLAPLIIAGKTIGIVIVESQVSNAFDESDLETLESLAFQVASGIEYARLLRKTREMAIVDERTRLARDMHDGVAQNLAYLLIQVDRCLNMTEENGKLERQLEQVSLLLEQNIDELRRNIFDLRPVDLEGKPIFEVFENFVAEFGRRWNLQTTCFIDDKAEDVSPEVQRSLYRILQEALSNARQHAQCTRLSVRLTVTDNQRVTLEIEDDGRGFDVNQTTQNRHKRKGKGLGLISIRERAESAGGQLTVESVEGRGTRIFAAFPLHTDLPLGRLTMSH
jgi:signal transduction histidine kinase/CheY-like chemotaxis protein